MAESIFATFDLNTLRNLYLFHATKPSEFQDQIRDIYYLKLSEWAIRLKAENDVLKQENSALRRVEEAGEKKEREEYQSLLEYANRVDKELEELKKKVEEEKDIQELGKNIIGGMDEAGQKAFADDFFADQLPPKKRGRKRKVINL